MIEKPILDCCCGFRMFWYNKENKKALFTDIRKESGICCDGRSFNVCPDKIEDFTSLSFPDKSFKLVVFDPPHLRWAGDNSWMKQKYGRLPENWGEFINKGIHECMRVLDDYGVLIFKWNETQIKISSILKYITDYEPLFGHFTNKNQNTIWMTFMKFPNDSKTSNNANK